jgi:hypothetical protein
MVLILSLRYFLLNQTAYPVRSRLMNTESGTGPVLNKKWPCETINIRFGNQFRDSRQEIFLCSILLMITWCSAPGTSILAFLGIIVGYHIHFLI